jgi:hypothetical protein
MAGATASTADVAEVEAWERRLAAAVSGAWRPTAGGDPGFRLYRQLVSDFRSGHLARVLRYTLANLLATLGQRETRELLETYQAETPPDSFPAVEAHHFAQFVRHRTDVVARVPFLDEVLSFEHALVRATLFGEETELVWSVDPTALLGRLDQGLPPGTLQAVHSTMRVQHPTSPTPLQSERHTEQHPVTRNRQATRPAAGQAGRARWLDSDRQRSRARPGAATPSAAAGAGACRRQLRTGHRVAAET